MHAVDGSIIRVRDPLHESEEPVIWPHWLVEDIKLAVEKVENQDAEFLHPPLEIPGKGIFAIYTLGSVHHGLWQL